MKKSLLAIAAVALLFATSCKKGENKPDTPNTPPVETSVLAEGIYQPAVKIATIAEGSTSQQWTWSNKLIDHIDVNGDNASTMLFNYNGNYLTSVTSGSNVLRYTYSGDKFAHSEIAEGSTVMLAMDFQHNAAGKISAANITVDNSFFLSLIGDLIGGLLSNKAVTESKFDITGSTVAMAFQWQGDNVNQTVLTGSANIEVTSEDVATLQDIGLIPEEYLSAINLALMMGGGRLPLALSLCDTTINTFDAMNNPLYCYWGEGVDPTVLSKNNILTTQHRGTLKLSAMGMELLNRPYDMEAEEYLYQYNAKNYPTTKTSATAVTTYTYQE